jgi:hypothetical protein
MIFLVRVIFDFQERISQQFRLARPVRVITVNPQTRRETMRSFRLIIVALATVLALALGVFGLIHRPGPMSGGDDIIIKGGSMEIQCGANHGKDCLQHTAGSYSYTHTKANAHITGVVVKDDAGVVLYSSSFVPAHQPTVAVTFK